MEEKLDKPFHLKERGTTVRTEVLAGLTTFVTAAYALAVNPSVMSATGTFNTAGIGVVLFCVGLVITGVLMARNVKGINLLRGNHKKISPMMYVLAVVFILKYVLI